MKKPQCTDSNILKCRDCHRLSYNCRLAIEDDQMHVPRIIVAEKCEEVDGCGGRLLNVNRYVGRWLEIKYVEKYKK